MTPLQKLKHSVATHEMLKSGDSVLVALSGGPDSVAMLHLLNRLRRPLKLTLSAVHIDHGIRERAARHEARICRELCEKLDIPLTLVREDIPSLALRTKRGLEETGREFRYETFSRLADQLGCN